jgi:hypothetical protein
MSARVTLALLLALALGCGDDDGTTERRDAASGDGGSRDGSAPRDAAEPTDGSEPEDGGPPCESALIHGEAPALATIDECGRLSYGLYANEGESDAVHRLPDFSFAGYRQGGVALPEVPTVVTVDPGDGDDLGRIQAAIDEVSAMDLTDGVRGAVRLSAGTYQVDGTIEIAASGVVLRGDGQGTDGTVIVATRREQHDLITVTGAGGLRTIDGSTERITSDVVPVGATAFTVADGSGFSAGDLVGVARTPNQAWIDALGMGPFGWTASGYRVVHERTVVAVDGNELTIDVPIVDTIAATYGGGEVFRAEAPGRIEEVGVEGLRLVSEYSGAEDEDHGWKAVRLQRVTNSWVRDVTAEHFGFSTVSVERGSTYVTVQDCAMRSPISIVTGGRRYSFYADDATGVLFQRLYSEQARHDFATGSQTPGPNVWLDCYSTESTNDDGPHHRWATGLLFDNLLSYELHVENRQDSGTGHGWSGAQVLFWNSTAEGLRSFAPTGAMNWVVGTMGAQQPGQWTTEEPLGFYESHDRPVEPRSLYLTQLRDRLGAAAVRAVTIPAQREGRIWNRLLGWAGEGALEDATPAAGDPTCSGGVAAGSACCAASCGECGGSGCGGRPGGGENCCSSGVWHSGRSCATHGPPCILDPAFAPLL